MTDKKSQRALDELRAKAAAGSSAQEALEDILAPFPSNMVLALSPLIESGEWTMAWTEAGKDMEPRRLARTLRSAARALDERAELLERGEV